RLAPGGGADHCLHTDTTTQVDAPACPAPRIAAADPCRVGGAGLCPLLQDSADGCTPCVTVGRPHWRLPTGSGGSTEAGEGGADEPVGGGEDAWLSRPCASSRRCRLAGRGSAP